MQIRKTFSKNLKLFRQQEGFTQEGLAEKMGVTARWIQKLESDKCPNVTIETVGLFAKALSRKPAKFLE